MDVDLKLMQDIYVILDIPLKECLCTQIELGGVLEEKMCNLGIRFQV